MDGGGGGKVIARMNASGRQGTVYCKHPTDGFMS